MGEKLSIFAVAPRVGAWIEIPVKAPPADRENVAPRVGAWIEILSRGIIRMQRYVAPRVGAWIEINSLVLDLIK